MTDDDLLTTAEAARLAHVGASSVKRWADQGRLECVRTVGGHRRFRRGAIERFLSSLRGSDAGSASRWADMMTRSDAYELLGEVSAARGRLGSYQRVADEIGRGLVEVGERWERGEISVLDEHAASEKLARALGRTAESLPSDPAAPEAVLATVEGDDHTLGLALVELVLREAGWAVRWAGAKTSTEHLVELVREGTVELVALGASRSSTDTEALVRELRALGALCVEQGVHLVLGGSGAWPDPPEHGVRVRDFELLARLASDWRRPAR